MERRHQFVPAITDQLEGRVVLSKTTLGLSPVVSGLAPHLQALNRRQTALIAEVNQAFDSFQNDFDQARATYFASLQTTATTPASTSSGSSSSGATSPVQAAATALLDAANAAPANPTVSALVSAANALVSAATTAPPSAAPTAASVSAATTVFQDYTKQRTLLLSQQLIGSFVQSPQGTARAPGQPYALKQLIESKIIGPKGKGPAGSLITSLNQTTAEINSSMLSSSPTTTLYTLSQDNAIAAARTAVVNGVSIIKSGAFGIKKTSHY